MEISEQDVEELRRLEEALWRSEVRFDRERVEAILAPDFFEFGRSSRVYDRGDALALPPREINAALPLAEFEVRLIGADVAQVTYVSAVATERGEERALRSSIWSRTGDGWQLRFHQGTPIPGDSLPDLLGGTREVRGEEVIYRYANGLTIKTEVFNKEDRRRILPLGSPQEGLMNHMLNFPEVVRGKRVFEPFAGSGALGFMALKLGAQHVDFLDISHRAPAFQRENAELNQFSPSRFRSIEQDIATFRPERRYDLILATPPFVPTPDGIDGTITSNGGTEGNRFVEILLTRLEEFLEPEAEALIYVLQLVSHQQPLLVDLVSKVVVRRLVELTPSQERPISFGAYSEAYSLLFPESEEEIGRWKSALLEKYGAELTLSHYVARVRAQGRRPASCLMRNDFAEKFGESFLVPSEDEKGLSLGRVFENFVPSSRRA